MAKELKDAIEELKERDPFIGVFDIHFTGPRRMSSPEVRIVHWRTTTNGELFYLIDEHGSVYNFNNINCLFRIGD